MATEQQERWKKYINERIGIETQTEFALRIGVSQSSVSAWRLYGHIPSVRVLRSIADRLGEPAYVWLAAAGFDQPPDVAAILTGGGAAPGVTTIPGVGTSRPVIPSDSWLPVIGFARADRFYNPEQDATDEHFPCLQEHAQQAEAGVIHVEGHSMAPEVQPKDILGISRVRPAIRGRIVLAKQGDTVYLKRLARKSGRTIRLESDNPAYEPVEGDDIEVIGVAVWLHRQLP